MTGQGESVWSIVLAATTLVTTFLVVATLAIPVTATSFLLAVSLALYADVITQHCSEHEVLFGAELVQWPSGNEPDGIQAFASAEVNIDVLSAGRLQYVGDALALESFDGLVAVLLGTGEKHHLAHSFLKLVDVV